MSYVSYLSAIALEQQGLWSPDTFSNTDPSFGIPPIKDGIYTDRVAISNLEDLVDHLFEIIYELPTQGLVHFTRDVRLCNKVRILCRKVHCE